MSAVPPLIAGESTVNFACVNKDMRVYEDLLVDGTLTIQSSGSLSIEGSAEITSLTAGTLRVTGNSNLGSTTASGLTVRSSINLSVTGTGLRLNEGGSAALMGVATLTAGSVGITNSAIAATSRIFLTTQTATPLGSIGALYVSGRSVGNSMTISSTAAADSSTFAYIIYNPYT